MFSFLRGPNHFSEKTTARLAMVVLVILYAGLTTAIISGVLEALDNHLENAFMLSGLVLILLALLLVIFAQSKGADPFKNVENPPLSNPIRIISDQAAIVSWRYTATLLISIIAGTTISLNFNEDADVYPNIVLYLVIGYFTQKPLANVFAWHWYLTKRDRFEDPNFKGF